MKSIKEKSFELFPEMQTDSDNRDVIEAHCDRDKQRKAFVKGANYVLGAIEWLLNSQKFVDNPLQGLFELIEQLKK